MKGKLIKKSSHNRECLEYWLYCEGLKYNLSPMAKTGVGHGLQKLSLKNCQAIEKGYDLENMADLYGAKIKGNVDFKLGANQGFEEGFLKSLELLGDKKFTKDDMIKFMQFIIRTEELENTSSVSVNTANYYLEKFCEQTQKLEWDVEIVMNEPIGIGDKYTPDNFPQLDADGCLILKRI
jgi:hypothetical protein